MSVKIESILVPIGIMPKERIDDLNMAALRKLIEVTAEELKLDEDKLITRDLTPTDLGLTNEVWLDLTGGTENAWENSNIASKTIADERFIAITGVIDASDEPAVSALRFTVGGAKVARFSLDRINDQKVREGISLSPIIITQNQPVTMEFYVKNMNAQTEIKLVGIVCEKSGKTLKP